MGPHTHRASAPPSAYQGENSQGRESEPRESRMVRMRERAEQEVADLYQPPLLRFHSPVNQSSTFWLLLWYDTAGRWVKTATSAVRGKTSQILCLHMEPLPSHPESERGQFGFLQLSAEHSCCLPALTMACIPQWTPPMRPSPRTPLEAHAAMHNTNRSHVGPLDLFYNKLLCAVAVAVFPFACILALSVSLSWECITCSGKKKKKTTSYHVKTEAALSENSLCFPLSLGLRM